MGCYINPQSCTKEEWLKKNGVQLPEAPSKILSDSLPVCLVSNFSFSAASVCYNERELEVFSDPVDYKIKLWFSVKKVDLRKVLRVHDLHYVRDWNVNY